MNPAAISIDTLIAACVTIVVDIIVAVVVWVIQRKMAEAEKAKAERDRKADEERKAEREKREREHRELMERFDRMDERLDKLEDGSRTNLRNDLVRMHREWAEEKGSITLEALEFCEKTYESYHCLNGNGTGTKLWNDIEALPVKEER